MHNTFFESGTARVGKKDVAFSLRGIPEGFRMYVPASFNEDKNLVSNYTYLFSKDKSPLSIAIKFSAAATNKEREKMITHYFNQAMETLTSAEIHSGDIHYRETVTQSQYISVYSLRFAVEVEGGLLFGCFNCSAAYKDDWQPVVLQMLQNIQAG